MNFSAPFIKRPVMTSIVMMAILFMGFFAFRKLPVTDLPTVDYPIISVTAGYAGASPEVMARTVVTPLEKELANIQGLKHLFSHSSKGFCAVTLLFELSRDMDDVIPEVQAALKRAEAHLPSDLKEKPAYHKTDEHQEAIIYLVLTSPLMPVADLYEYAHTRIEQRLARIEGVGKVEVYGSPYAVRIYLNPELLAARSLTFEEVHQAVASATGTLPVGVLDTPGRKFTLEVPGRVQNAEDLAHLLVAPQVRLKDIAEVVDGHESDAVFRYVTQGSDQLAIILAIQKQNNANAVKISQEIQRLIPEIRGELPASMQLELWFDKATWIKEAIEDVEWSLVLAFALVIGVIFLSLRTFRETLIAGAALPLSIIGTFIIMGFLHFNIDLLSLLALTLAMGFVIDDAIVVLENIVRHKEMGLPPEEAALQGSKQISFTILSMTLSLVAVFIPMLFMQDIIGRLFREFSVTLAVSILVSGFVSLTLTPMLASKFLSTHHKPAPSTNRALLSAYDRTLKWCLNHRLTTLSVGISTIVLTIFLFRFLPVDLFPEEDRGFIWSMVQIPSGMSKSDLEIYQEKLNAIVKKHPAVDKFCTLNYKDSQIHLMRLTPSGRAPQSAIITDLQNQLNGIPGVQAYIKGVQLISNSFGGGGHAKNSYQFTLRGADAQEVRLAAEALKKKLLSNPLFLNPDLNLKADDPKLEITIFEDQAEKLGLTRQTIQTLLQGAYAGASLGKIEKDAERYNVFLELDSRFQKNSEALSKLYVKTPASDFVPLKAVASWKETLGLHHIEHLDLLPSTILYFGLAKETPLNEALDTLKKIAAETLPASVSGKLEGVAEMVDKTSGDTVMLLILAAVAMYVVLGILYESFVHPLTILSALPFACLGGVLTLLAFKEPLSLYSMVGFLLLIGIVKKNGIMMVDYALEIQRSSQKSPLDAIHEACLVRFRPIMMTTIAAIMGALPIAIGLGAGSETRRGLGLVIAGGLLFSQFLTLYITPILYLYLEKLSRVKER